MINDTDAYKFHQNNKKSMLFECREYYEEHKNNMSIQSIIRYYFHHNNIIICEKTTSLQKKHFFFYTPKSTETTRYMTLFHEKEHQFVNIDTIKININKIFHYQRQNALYNTIQSITKDYNQKINILKIFQTESFNIHLKDIKNNWNSIILIESNKRITHNKYYSKTNLTHFYNTKKTHHESLADLKKMNHPDYTSWEDVDQYLFQLCNNVKNEIRNTIEPLTS